MSELHSVAARMVEKGKGILAADESTGTCTKRFEGIGVESTFESRGNYRSNLFTAPGLESYISGVILYDETFRQNIFGTDHSIPKYLQSKDILPGIKVDTGAHPLKEGSDEKNTTGLDGLAERLGEYYALGARFAKWRAVITLGDRMPSNDCILVNAEGLAKYALSCQQASLVPIVEPEVLMDGTHTIDTSFDVTERTLTTVFDQLEKHNVDLRGIVLKPNMVLSGYDCKNQASVEEVAQKTLECLMKNVPSRVPGIAFLSGGQSDELATLRLNEINKYDTNWNVTFSYGRALQQDALKAWAGKLENTKITQELLLSRAKSNSLASTGSL
ncbi:MAG: fructose-bisphosphate aldolase class I [Candidatus Marinimicrobia bacterium]|jgi:fructose-bisphosphate aldolase class I|nr:fructose-bisphosphate aldolase class I [Candidatus Neomarinimicrobiota bacterium]MBT3943952.1 fructose-bisphosphate aldolase class I [Candidatus Neomarinimicrobiota bacterium]MBT4111789.1 fructose-bisphosphate aldolase class I [Candidatus Neomarinimicrobiota bacterium]MBT4317108.1 fructose-bisphosphate aldolase class I [Candidatus Neomarinimicrobiota bacterium]MBT4706711.1 fructose-bisphosphate aldolase class I [Candidatus Neomarinimicrobiota bacterium]